MPVDATACGRLRQMDTPFQRILFIQTLRRVLTVTLLELLLEPLILASQLVDRPFQSAYQHHKLIDTQSL